MHFQRKSPPADLKSWVECVWVLRGALAAQGQVILPDGRLELIFHLADAPLGPGGRQPAVLVAGRTVEALELRPHGAIDTLGVRLRPGALAGLLPCDRIGPAEPMDAILGPWSTEMRERLVNGRTDVERIERAWVELRRLAAICNRETDCAVVDSVRRIDDAHGRGSMDDFLPNGIGMRQWQRRFALTTGFSPKSFARIIRFQHLIRLYESNQMRTWADLALEAGFYDQAHLANAFRAFSGQSPEAYFRGGRGMAEFYRDAIFQDTERAGA